jgi:hypothetical protein
LWGLYGVVYFMSTSKSQGKAILSTASVR